MKMTFLILKQEEAERLILNYSFFSKRLNIPFFWPVFDQFGPTMMFYRSLPELTGYIFHSYTLIYLKIWTLIVQ